MVVPDGGLPGLAVPKVRTPEVSNTLRSARVTGLFSLPAKRTASNANFGVSRKAKPQPVNHPADARAPAPNRPRISERRPIGPDECRGCGEVRFMSKKVISPR